MKIWWCFNDGLAVTVNDAAPCWVSIPRTLMTDTNIYKQCQNKLKWPMNINCFNPNNYFLTVIWITTKCTNLILQQYKITTTPSRQNMTKHFWNLSFHFWNITGLFLPYTVLNWWVPCPKFLSKKGFKNVASLHSTQLLN